jgi:hypothetical protein
VITPRTNGIEKQQRGERKTPATDDANSDSAPNVCSHFKRSVAQLLMIIEIKAISLIENLLEKCPSSFSWLRHCPELTYRAAGSRQR